MRFSILAIGKIKEPWMKAGIAEYTKRLAPFAKVDIIEQTEEKVPDRPSQKDVAAVLEKEGEKLLRFRKDGVMVLLDTKGQELSSTDLAEWIRKKTISGTSHFHFVIGGPYGNGNNLRREADLRLSLGPMTLTHQMARLILTEQLYRAMKIIRHEPYHL